MTGHAGRRFGSHAPALISINGRALPPGKDETASGVEKRRRRANDIPGEIRAEDIIMSNKMAVLLSFAGTMLLASQLPAQSAPLMAQSAMAKPGTTNPDTLEVRYGGWHRGWGGWHGGWRGGWGWGGGAFAAGALIG